MIDTLQKYVSFYIDNKPYGIDLKYIQEFIENVEYTPLPHKLNNIVGVANLRGRIITVVDMGNIFSELSCDNGGLLMVMRDSFIRGDMLKKPCVAFLVDKTGPIIEACSSELIAIPSSDKNNNKICSHSLEQDNQVVSIVNAEKLYEMLNDAK